jgi:glycosyltransferase involved in cell wall biosynthesis
MKLSIAMATYNGERHLRQQLESFASQDRPPDELVVCDDQSTDRTLEVVGEFAEKAPFPVIARRNEQRLGAMKNFEAAASLCTGDVIFFSDQDDVWLPGKLARHEAIYRDEPDVGMIFSNATIVDEQLRPMGQSLYEYVAFTEARRRRFESKSAFNLVIHRTFAFGCTMSFRSSLLAPLRPFPIEFMHDRWVQTLLASSTRFRALTDEYILYRQHGSQTLGINQKAWAEPSKVRRDLLESHIKAMEYLLGRVDSLGEGWSGRAFGLDVRGRIVARIAHLRRRESIRRRSASGALIIARELLSGAYNRHGEHALYELRSDIDELRSGPV